jgi:hypothetical protein
MYLKTNATIFWPIFNPLASSFCHKKSLPQMDFYLPGMYVQHYPGKVDVGKWLLPFTVKTRSEWEELTYIKIELS